MNARNLRLARSQIDVIIDLTGKYYFEEFVMKVELYHTGTELK